MKKKKKPTSHNSQPTNQICCESIDNYSSCLSLIVVSIFVCLCLSSREFLSVWKWDLKICSSVSVLQWGETLAQRWQFQKLRWRRGWSPCWRTSRPACLRSKMQQNTPGPDCIGFLLQLDISALKYSLATAKAHCVVRVWKKCSWNLS